MKIYVCMINTEDISGSVSLPSPYGFAFFKHLKGHLS